MNIKHIIFLIFTTKPHHPCSIHLSNNEYDQRKLYIHIYEIDISDRIIGYWQRENADPLLSRIEPELLELQDKNFNK